ncbi:MAG: hypothetical protein ACOCUO_00575 [archaeon]
MTTLAASLVTLATSSSHGLPFVGPGTYLIFGIVLLPIYIMIASWFLGKPRDNSKTVLGLIYLAGLTIALWGGLFVVTMIIMFLFF